MGTDAKSSGLVRFGVFEADLLTGELRKNGQKVRLQDQPFRVLALLLQRAGELVARDIKQLLSGKLESPIVVDEHGNHVSPVHVWTGTAADGKPVHCCGPSDAWTNGSDKMKGTVGRNTNSDKGWTEQDVHTCDHRMRLYCFGL